VRYGANSMYAPIKEVITSIGCNNNVFGDPVSGTRKICECTTPTPSTTPMVICVCLCIYTHVLTDAAKSLDNRMCVCVCVYVCWCINACDSNFLSCCEVHECPC
jgi:hypothetical protein